ncbi:MAG: porin [Polyangiales bacterium]
MARASSRIATSLAIVVIQVFASGGVARAQDPAPVGVEPVEEQPKPKWYDAVTVSAFVDGYAGWNFNAPKPNVNALRAYDATNGFALHWAGLDTTIDAGPVGGTLSLRFGPSAPLYAGPDADVGLANVKQAYATWKPFERWTIDFGKYDQPFGSEVADSQGNPNYTRSALYWYAQPLFFTGLRVGVAVTEQLELKAFAVNGWNRSVDVNTGKSFGAQLVVKPTDGFLVAAGYLGGPEQADTETDAAGTTTKVPGANKRLRHLADLVVDVTLAEKLRLLFNADYGMEKLLDQTVRWYGGNLVAAYAITEVYSVAARGEYYVDADGYTLATGRKTTLIDGTLTLAAAPTKNLILKLDGRLDRAEVDGVPEGIFLRGLTEPSKTQVTATFGVVAKTD